MKRLPKEDRAGLYVTVIVHLLVLIILLAVQLGTSIKKEHTFVLDFTRAEQLEKLQKELALKQAINDRLNEILASAGSTPVRNVAVDRSALKDDRNSAEETEKLYRDAEALQKALKQGADLPDEDYVEDPSPRRKKEEKTEAARYSGPSVLSYELEGRKASHLPIPAYRCLGAGQVTVLITVNPGGTVIDAKVDDAVSSKDGCLRNFAVRAARLSKFSAKADAPAKQQGNIVYEFVAQY